MNRTPAVISINSRTWHAHSFASGDIVRAHVWYRTTAINQYLPVPVTIAWELTGPPAPTVAGPDGHDELGSNVTMFIDVLLPSGVDYETLCPRLAIWHSARGDRSAV